jgi:hypothetical protein
MQSVDFVDTFVTVFDPKRQPEDEEISHGRKPPPPEHFNVKRSENPAISSTVGVDEDFVFLPSVARCRTDRRFLYICYGNP